MATKYAGSHDNMFEFLSMHGFTTWRLLTHYKTLPTDDNEASAADSFVWVTGQLPRNSSQLFSRICLSVIVSRLHVRYCMLYRYGATPVAEICSPRFGHVCDLSRWKRLKSSGPPRMYKKSSSEWVVTPLIPSKHASTIIIIFTQMPMCHSVERQELDRNFQRDPENLTESLRLKPSLTRLDYLCTHLLSNLSSFTFSFESLTIHTLIPS